MVYTTFKDLSTPSNNTSNHNIFVGVAHFHTSIRPCSLGDLGSKVERAMR